MKSFLLLLPVFFTINGFSQKKKKVDPRDVQIDTLTKQNALLTEQVDSISRDRAVYYGLYATLKDKVVLKEFDPAKFPEIVDSMRVARESETAPIASLRDSLSLANRQNVQLKAELDSMSHVAKSHVDKAKLVAELKDLKSLLDAKVITQAEYDEKKKLVMNKWH